MIYKCEPCNYQTDSAHNHARHLKGLKHNANNKNICRYCNNPQSDINTHIKNCGYANNYQIKLEILNQTYIDKIKSLELKLDEQRENYNEKINIYSSQIKFLEAQLQEQKNYTNNLMQKDNKYTDTLIASNEKYGVRMDNLIQNTGIFANNSLNTINNTVSALKFIQTNYNTAPPLKALSNYNCFKKTTTDKFIPELLHYYKNDQLVKYIGDTYIQEYLKDNPNEQAMWNSDQSRLSYYVRETGKGKGEVNYDEWTQDKQGLKIIDITIKPILKFFYDEVSTYMTERVNDGDYKLMESCAKLKEFLNGSPQKRKMGKIVKCLPEEIVKYIGPKFLINKAKKAVKLLKQSSTTIEEVDDSEEIIEEHVIPCKRIDSSGIQPNKSSSLEVKKQSIENDEISECDDTEFNNWNNEIQIIDHYQEKEEEIYDTNKQILRLKPPRKNNAKKAIKPKPKK
jgi:hypothetical protein